MNILVTLRRNMNIAIKEINKSKRQIALGMGLDPSGFNRMLRGERNIKAEDIFHFARLTNRTPNDLYGVYE